jgi:hypothetical protein
MVIMFRERVTSSTLTTDRCSLEHASYSEYPTNANVAGPIRINMKVFSRADLTRVFDFLGPKPKSSRSISLVSDDPV